MLTVFITFESSYSHYYFCINIFVHSQIGFIFCELNHSEIKLCASCVTLSVLCVQSSGKLEMERGMVKPMIRGEQQDSRSHTLLLFLPSSSLSAIFILSAPQTDPPLVYISCYLPFSWFYFLLSGLRTFLSTE